MLKLKNKEGKRPYEVAIEKDYNALALLLIPKQPTTAAPCVAVAAPVAPVVATPAELPAA